MGSKLIGIISDIHGNIIALNAVLEELKKRKVQKIICLGDLIGETPYSEEVIQRIIELGDKVAVVRGNREQYLIEGMPKFIHDDKKPVKQEQLDKQEWLKDNLSNSSMKFISRLPTEITYEIEGKTIYGVHYPMKKEGKYKRHIKKANLEQIEELFLEEDADIYLYGHTHEEMYNSGENKMYINPGPLGCPGNTGMAPYGVLKIFGEKIEYEQLYKTYNTKEVVESIQESKFPGYKTALKLFFGMEE